MTTPSLATAGIVLATGGFTLTVLQWILLAIALVVAGYAIWYVFYRKPQNG